MKERSGHEEGMRALRLLLLPKKLPLESEVFGLVYETEKRIVFKGLGMRCGRVRSEAILLSQNGR